MTSGPVDSSKEPGLRIVQIILDHAAFSHRVDPISIKPNGEGETVLAVSFVVQELEQNDGLPAVRVTVGVATPAESTHPYILDFAVTGIIVVEKGQENLSPLEYAGMAGAPLLYPFLREVVANVSGRGRVGPVWLKPFNMQKAMTGHLASRPADEIDALHSH